MLVESMMLQSTQAAAAAQHNGMLYEQQKCIS